MKHGHAPARRSRVRWRLQKFITCNKLFICVHHALEEYRVKPAEGGCFARLLLVARPATGASSAMQGIKAELELSRQQLLYWKGEAVTWKSRYARKLLKTSKSMTV